MQTAAYAQTLRALGQAVEAARFETFNLQSDGTDYYVRGETVVEIQPTPQPAQSSSIWQKLRGNETTETNSQLVRKALQLHYTTADIDRLESEGKARRRDAQAMPDAYSTSQVLRAAGAYLDRKRAKLLDLSKHNGTIKVHYETSLGATTEELTVSYLYDLAVHMYMRRSERPKEDAAP